MPCRLTLAVAIVIHSLCLVAVAQPSETPAAQQQEVPWPVRLGLRSLQVEQAFPLIDRVVLVPDAATYLDELAKWSPRGRWPVLIEDSVLSAMFIRRFRPAQVIRRESIGDAPITREAVEQTVITAFGADPAMQSIRQAFEMHQFVPAGVIVTSLNDTAWPAAAALSAGRGQPLIWIDDQYGQPDGMISRREVDDLAAQIEDGLVSLGWTYNQLGSDIDAITICRRMAGRVNLPRPDNGQMEPAAMTDYLGRRSDNRAERYALVGWIFGSESRSAYMAMCSLFLPRVNVVMYDTYNHGEPGGWAQYDMTPATGLLSEHGFEVTHLNERRANEVGWLGMIANGIATDLFVMNSRGNAHEFGVHGSMIWAPDVPILNTPIALHLTHSWSLRSPENINSVGGRWLDRGAYAYVGSMQEPYLAAFVPPTMLATRWVNRIPFLVGARYWTANPAPFGGPWKVNTIGDPLMLLAPPLQHNKQRISQTAEYGEDLFARAEQLLAAVRNEPDPRTLADTIALLDLIGRDDIALPLWRLASSLGDEHARLASRAALGPLFRARDADGFMRAWLLLPHRDDLATDMLWHLFSPRLSMLDEDSLLQMQAAIRRPAAHVDIRRLAPHLARRISSQHVRSLIERELDRSEGRDQNQLQRILRDY